jgi:hypothetical protein
VCYKNHKLNCEGRDKIVEDVVNNERPLNLDESQDIIVDQSSLEKLKENMSIMNKLKNKKLKKIIRNIDSAKFKKRILEKIIANDKDFKEFVDEILSSLGYLDDNKHFIY